MFEFINKIISGVKRMISRATVKRVLGDNPKITTSMIEKIELWQAMLKGEAPWCDDYIKSMKVEHGICREFSDVVLSEMDINISNEKLLKIFNKCTRDLNENLQEALGLGSMCIKPVGNGQAEYVTADKFFIMDFGIDDKPNDVVFVDVKKMGSSSYYVRLERHSVKNGYLTITNKAFESLDRNNFTRVIPLDTVDEWAMLHEEVSYPGMKSMDFGYYRNPLKNRIDDTKCGVSIFDDAIEHVQRVDNQGARLEWEFESGERAIHLSSSMIKKRPNGQNGVSQLNKRLYRGLNTDSEDLYKDYSPEFRDENIINGLETEYRQIEFIVGLAYGDLSDPKTIEKTAEEIKASKLRKYNRVNAIQNNLKDCLEDFTAGLAFYEGMLMSGYEFTCNFTDSILTDEKSERQQDKEDVAMGIMSHVEYRMKWYGEDEATARANLPEQNAVME